MDDIESRARHALSELPETQGDSPASPDADAEGAPADITADGAAPGEGGADPAARASEGRTVKLPSMAAAAAGGLHVSGAQAAGPSSEAEPVIPAGFPDGPEAPAGPAESAEPGAGADSGSPAASAAPDALGAVAALTDAAIAEKRDERQKRRRAAIIAAAVLGCLLAAYVAGFTYYGGHFLPHTGIGSYDVSGLSSEDAAAFLEERSQDYALEVAGQGLDFTITPEATGLKIDGARVVENAMQENAAWKWPLFVFDGRQSQDLSDAIRVTYDEAGFTALVQQKVDELNAGATDSVSAGIAYDPEKKGFAVVPEQIGTKLDAALVVAKVEDAAFQMRDSVTIGEGELLMPPIRTDDPRLAQAVADADAMLGADFPLMLGDAELAHVDTELVAGWIGLDGDVSPVLDEGRYRGYLGALAAKTNTIGKVREYDTPRGEHVVVEGGVYGWEIDYDPFVEGVVAAVTARSTAPFEIPCTSYAASVPNDFNVDFGSRYIDVNLSTQHAVFYDGDAVLWEADIVSGIPDAKHTTPYGVWEINLKESPSKLIGEMVGDKPEYETVVQYWMPFVGNAIGFHDATWQPGFGGALYASGYGSHGCVNLSYYAAEELYAIVAPGTPVITHA